MPDAVIIDGDHNYYTVSEELRLIDERAADESCRCCSSTTSAGRTPAATTTTTPERIPEEHRQPIVEGAGLFPGDPGVRRGGLPYRWPAAREGGPRNGVLTAIEDFVAGRDGLRLAVVPAFFGLGVIWQPTRPGPTPWRRSWIPGTATRCSSGWRTTGSATSPRRTPARSRPRRRSKQNGRSGAAAEARCSTRRAVRRRRAAVADRWDRDGKPRSSKGEIRRALAD